MKKIIIGLIVVIIVLVAFMMLVGSKQEVVNPTPEPITQTPTTTQPVVTPEPVVENKPVTVLGTSVQGKEIKAYHFGTGPKEVVLVAGTHGGYSANTSLLAFEMIDALEAKTIAIPENVKVTIIPILNPDGLQKSLGVSDRFTADKLNVSEAKKAEGRFNAHTVDLNRNFDCDWKASSLWQTKTVSGGSAPFSEPEAAALKAYVEKNKPTAVVSYYSAVGGVFASNCFNGVSEDTNKILGAYSKASGYKSYNDFDFYETTGDMTNWLAKIKIPAISVLLTDHKNTEYTKNKAGLVALLATLKD